MSTFTCEVCGQEFEQKSRYERHMLTSHPRQAPSAADIEAVLKDVSFPQSRNGLIEAARANDASSELLSVLRDLPAQEYRDSAEVARSLGEIRAHERKPSHQPSELGGERAMESLSAARLATLFSGLDFPASAADLKEHAQNTASKQEMATIQKFRGGTYDDMADIAKEFGRVT